MSHDRHNYDDNSWAYKTTSGSNDWFPVDEWQPAQCKVIILTRRCLIGTVPRYIAADCVPVSEMAQRHHLRSTAGHQLVVPSYRLNSCGLREFSVLGPILWNSLPRLLCESTTLLALDILWRHIFFRVILLTLGALAVTCMCYRNSSVTYSLTYGADVDAGSDLL